MDDLSQLFESAFGESPLYATEAAVRNRGMDFTDESAKKTSWLGTPVMFPIKFKRGAYQIYKPNGEVEKVERSDFYLPPCLVQFSRAKNLTQTHVLGDTGSVKEMFGFDDWNIKIKGLCLDEPDRKAYDQLEALLDWEEIAAGIDVSGSLFADKQIYNIVIKSIDVKQIQGKPGVIPFTIDAVSEDEAILVL
ncbi:MAG: DUF6046 domain-containing protein [Flavobacteriales bacterium]